MTFAQLATWIIADMTPDGDSFLPLPTAPTYFDHPWGQRLAAYLSNFTCETYVLFAASEPITVEAGDREFSFADSDNCAKHFFDVERIFINREPLAKARHVRYLTHKWTPATPPGTPSCWAQMDSSRILFDVECASSLDGTFAQGFYRHPAISSDDQVVEIEAPEHVELFSRYAQTLFREKVASDEIGLSRLQRLDQQAFNAIQQLRGDRLSRFLSDLR